MGIMIGVGSQASSADVLVLIQCALDEFDAVSLEATIRRTVRIANLMGETYAALRLGFELKPTGGHPPANAEMTRRLMADQSAWRDPDGVAEAALAEYMAEHRMPNGLVDAHSIAEIEFWQRERLPADQISDADYRGDLDQQIRMVSALARTRHTAFTYLCQWERQLTFSVNQGDALDAASKRVDGLLGAHAPDVVDRFNVAFRRLREAAQRDSEVEAGEELSHALTSCRRILKSVVDIVQPADPALRESEDGHPLSDKQYKNRLFEFLKKRLPSGSFAGALTKSSEALFDRFSTVDALASKGVHAQVALDEAHFCALSTYTLAGQILASAESADTGS